MPDLPDLPDPAAITGQRLRKRIAKLQKQRDHWKTEHDKFVELLQKLPALRRAVDRIRATDTNDKARHALLARIQEQELLIKQLTKG